MKKTTICFIIFFCLLSLCSNSAFASTKRIALFGLTLNARLYTHVEKSFVQTMSESKYKVSYKYMDVKKPLIALQETNIANPDLQIDIYSPEGDQKASTEMISKIKNGNYDVILTLGSPGTLAVKNAGITKTPVIFGAVIDPKALGIVKDFVFPGTNYTGVSTFVSMKLEFATLKNLVPNAKKVGTILNKGEEQLTVTINEAKQIKGQFGIDELVVIPVDTLGLNPAETEKELTKAAQSLVGKVDVIFIPGGAVTGSQASQAIINIANLNKIPTVAFSEPAVEGGATAGVVANLQDIGVRTADILNQVLSGVPTTSIPIFVQNMPDIIVNLGAAKKAGIEVPADLLDKATRVIE